jgi:hypothetical protein
MNILMQYELIDDVFDEYIDVADVVLIAFRYQSVSIIDETVHLDFTIYSIF